MSETTSDQKQRRILVVANETCGTSALCAEIGRRAADDDAQVLMISPALTRTRLEYWTSDVDRANAEVSQRLDRSISSLGELGVRARGEVGDPDPLQAIADALGTFRADENLIYSHPGRARELARARPRIQGAHALRAQRRRDRDRATRRRRGAAARERARTAAISIRSPRDLHASSRRVRFHHRERSRR